MRIMAIFLGMLFLTTLVAYPVSADDTFDQVKVALEESMKNAEEAVEEQNAVIVEYEASLASASSKTFDENKPEQIYDRDVVIPTYIAFLANYKETGIKREASPEMQSVMDDISDMPWREIEGEVRTFYATDVTNYYADLHIALAKLYELNQQMILSVEAMNLLEEKHTSGISTDFYDSLMEALPDFGQGSPATNMYIKDVYDYLHKVGKDSGISEGGEPSIIEGYVVSISNNEVMEGVLVVIGDQSDISGEDGHFYISEVMPGQVPVTLTASNINTWTSEFEVQGGIHYVDVQFKVQLSGEDDVVDGYVEEKDRLDSDGGGGLLWVAGGAIAGAGLLFYRNGLRKKNKKYKKEKDLLYQQGKKREEKVQKVKSDYKDTYVKHIDTEENLLEKERQKQLDALRIPRDDTVGKSIGKGLKEILKGAKSLAAKVKKVTDFVQDKVDKIKDQTVLSIKGKKLKIGHLTELFGDPFSKFSRIKKAVDSFNEKDPIKWAKEEIAKALSLANALKDKVNLKKFYDRFKNSHKDVGKFIEFQKKVHVVEAIVKNPEIILEDDARSKLENVANKGANLDNGLMDALNKGEQNIKKTITDQVKNFEKEVIKGLEG